MRPDARDAVFRAKARLKKIENTFLAQSKTAAPASVRSRRFMVSSGQDQEDWSEKLNIKQNLK
jgi:hypothetical protein